MSDLIKTTNYRHYSGFENFKDEYTPHDHVQFLDMELHEQNRDYLKLINCSANDLLEDGKLLPAKFLKVEAGQVIVKISRHRAVPRKGEYLTAVLLEDEMPDHRKWHGLSWRELRENHQVALSEAICVWHATADNPQFTLVGFRGISLAFAEKLIQDSIIVFGPKEPPRDYLLNLKLIAEVPKESSRFLQFHYSTKQWKPAIFDNNRHFPSFVINQLHLHPYLIIQGPPGTGKTYKIAELVAILLDQGYKVLVTALTNKALIELVKKNPLNAALENGLISKTNLTIDELNEVPGFRSSRSSGFKGELFLSTFYCCSSDASTAFKPPYDFVIMDEASQALLCMFEATVRLGKRVVWVGDQNQLPPIVSSKEKDIKHTKALPLINGMKTICDAFNFPSIMFDQTSRLSNRGAEYTSYFYTKAIKSKNHESEKYRYHGLPAQLERLFHSDGGPFWLQIPMSLGDEVPLNALQVVSSIVAALKVSDSSLDIAVLSKLKKTVTKLQVSLAEMTESKVPVLVDTVERVQGMTCDICFFLIPRTRLALSLDQAFFNVATSRASRHTIIVADSTLIDSPICKNGVRLYLEALLKSGSYSSLQQSNNNLELT